MKTPIWLLDVDGVINAVTASPDRRVFSDWRTVAVTCRGKVWPITYAQEVVDFITNLHNSGQVEVRWLTTWEDDANLDLRNKLGLPEFEVAGRHRPCSCDVSDCPLWFKGCAARALRKAEPDRPIIWTDDDLRWELEDLLWADEEGFCVVAPRSQHGLTALDLTTIQNYADKANGKAAA